MELGNQPFELEAIFLWFYLALKGVYVFLNLVSTFSLALKVLNIQQHQGKTTRLTPAPEPSAEASL